MFRLFLESRRMQTRNEKAKIERVCFLQNSLEKMFCVQIMCNLVVVVVVGKAEIMERKMRLVSNTFNLLGGCY